MPFKSGKSFNDVNKRIRDFTDDILPKRIQGELYDLITALGGYADDYTPIDTVTLRNSRTQTVNPSPTGFRATLGYYTGYAAALHNPKEGGRLDGWKPKPVPSPGKKTGAYNPQARQGWINIAWAQYGPELLEEFAEGITR